MKLDKLIKWQIVNHMKMGEEHAMLEKATYRGWPIIRETHTKYRNRKPWKSETIYWTLDDKNNYKSLEELLRAIEKGAEK
jgi:hypothetical protein